MIHWPWPRSVNSSGDKCTVQDQNGFSTDQKISNSLSRTTTGHSILQINYIFGPKGSLGKLFSWIPFQGYISFRIRFNIVVQRGGKWESL